MKKIKLLEVVNENGFTHFEVLLKLRLNLETTSNNKPKHIEPLYEPMARLSDL